MRSLHLGVVCSNTRAFTLYESLGFSVYGTDKEALYVNGEYLDEYLMSKKLR
jgi:RimJ/RimL family protein N-acetyltransferase